MKERETQSEPIDLMSRLESLDEIFPTLDPNEKDNDQAKIEYLVKNTFIDGLADHPAFRSLSLEEFLLERNAKSCPNSGVMQSKLESLEEEPRDAPEFPMTPSPRGASPRSLEFLKLDDEPSPEDELVMGQFPGAMLQGLTQQHHERSPVDSFRHVRVYSDGSTMAPSDGDSTLQDLKPGVMEQQESVPLVLELSSVLAPVQQENLGERVVVTELKDVLGKWSVGSTAHHFGRCKPCVFFWKDGCKDGQACEFCHTCPPEEKKRRRKEKQEWRKAFKATRTALRYGLF